MKKYEYKVERLNPFFTAVLENMLTDMGKQGWELTYVSPPILMSEGGIHIYYFRRELQEVHTLNG